MSMTETTSSTSLPEDLIMEILTRLSVKTLARFKSVSKSLLNLITRSDFVKLHLSRSRIRNSAVALLRLSGDNFASVELEQPQQRRPAVKLDIHPDVIKLLGPFLKEKHFGLLISKIIGICNGVVCFRKAREFVLYNPATRAYKQVPKPNASNYESPLIAFHDEFVYDCISDDLKIFRFALDEKIRKDSEGYMYNLKDNSWSKIGNAPPCRCVHKSCNYLYWISFNTDLEDIVLVRFDVSSNTSEEISLPPRVFPYTPRLGVLNGRLHITRNGKEPEIWMLNEDNCWSLVFRCSSEWEYYVKRCLFYSKDGRKIFLGLREKVPKFICCDLDSQTTSVVDILGLPEGATFKAMPWVESLVLLT